VLTPRSSWEPWHRKYDQDFAVAGFLPNVVQRGSHTGVSLVPLRGEYADVVVAWIDDRPRPAVQVLIDVLRATARESNLLSAG
jgi:hypothetical protein